MRAWQPEDSLEDVSARAEAHLRGRQRGAVEARAKGDEVVEP